MIAAGTVHPEEFPALEAGANVGAATGKAAGSATSTSLVAIGAIAGAIVTVTTAITLAVVLTRSSTSTVCVGTGAETCSSSLAENIQDIATGCEADIGICSSESCEGCDGMCCGAVFESRTAQCGGEEVVYSKVVNCSCISCDSREISVSGRVAGDCTTDSSCAAAVQVDGNEKTRSNSAGYYTFVATYPSNGKINMQIVADLSTYLSQPQQVQVGEEAQSYVDIQVTLVQLATPTTFDVSAGVTVDVGASNDVQVNIPPNSVFTESGTLFTGNVDVSINFIDTSTDEGADSMTFELTVQEEGSDTTTPFFSLGMFRITMKSSEDPTLNLQGQGIDITVFQSNESSSLTPNMWVMGDDGNWEDLGEVSRQGRSGRHGRSDGRSLTRAIDISNAQRIYNLDALMREYCYMKVRIFKNQHATQKAYGVTVKSVYKPVGKVWSNIMTRRSYSRGACIQIPCNRDSWPSERVHVTGSGYMAHGAQVDTSILTQMNYTVYELSFDLTIPVTGDIPISSDGPFYRKWYECYNAGINEKYFRFIRSLVEENNTGSNPSHTATPTISTVSQTSPSVPATTPVTPQVNGSVNFLRCNNITLGPQVLAYFNSTTSFDVTLYSLTTSGVIYNDQLITGQDLSLSGLNYLHLSVYSPVEGVLHRLYNFGTQLLYSKNNATSDPFNGRITSYPGAPFSVSINFKIGGNIELNGTMYQIFAVNSVLDSVPGSVPLNDITVIPGASASGCFTYIADGPTQTATNN